MFKKIIVLLVLVALISSCIPNERVIYLQNRSGDPSLEYDSLIELQRADYRFQPHDILSITFYSDVDDAVEKFRPIQPYGKTEGGGGGVTGQDLYFSGFNVDSRGFVEVNSLGKVKAAGLTSEELEELLEKKISEEKGINDILVNVRLDGIRYTIYGEVAAPGTYSLRRYEANIMDAIANAGDLTINAHRRAVEIHRQYPEGIRIHQVDVTDRALMRSEFYFLQSNDRIYVKPLKIRELGTGKTGLETFASIVSVISGVFLVINVINN